MTIRLHSFSAPLAFATLIVAASLSSDAEAAPCKKTCESGTVCAPSGECVSLCNPGCGEGELCSADGRCVSACNPACAASELCSPDLRCMSRCNPACPTSSTCRPDGTCEDTYRCDPPCASAFVCSAGGRCVDTNASTNASAPPTAPLRRMEFVDPESEVSSSGEGHPIWPLFVAGTASFGLGWFGISAGTAVVCATVPCTRGELPLSFVPLVNGFLVLAVANKATDVQTAMLIVGEVTEIGGLTLAILGLVLRQGGSTDVAARALEVDLGDATMSVSPTVSPEVQGLSATVRF